MAALPTLSSAARPDRNFTVSATDRCDLSALQPLRHTPNTRCGKAGGCQRKDCGTAAEAPRFKEHGISHSTPTVAAAEANRDSFFAMPGPSHPVYASHVV